MNKDNHKNKRASALAEHEMTTSSQRSGRERREGETD